MHTRHIPRALVRLTRTILFVWLLTATVQTLAGPAEPPLELLYSGESRLISGELIEINPAGRLVFKRENVFGNSTDIPALVDVAVPTGTLQRVKMGEHYIVGYSTFRYDKQYPKGLTPSRKGTYLISSVGLDPALFTDNPELRKILQLAATEQGRESTKLRKLLLKTFDENAPALQRLAAGQFWLDTNMSGKLNEKEKSVLRRAAFDEQINPTTRSLLITAAADRPANFGPWAAEAINRVLEITPVDGYPAGTADHTGLILLAFEEAGARRFQVPFRTVTRWLRSSQLGFLERASTLLEMLYPERSKAAFQEALRDAGPDAESRRFFEGKLRKVD